MYNTYNPYYGMQTQQPLRTYQPIEQPTTYVPQQIQKVGLQGKLVDSVDVVKVTDPALDGSLSYYPLTDGSAIVTKQLQTDGTSKILVYKPIDDKENVIKYVTQSDLDTAISSISIPDIKVLKDDIKSLKKQIKAIVDDLGENDD